MKTPALKFIHWLASIGIAMALPALAAAPSDYTMERPPASSTTLVLRGEGTRTQDSQSLYNARLYAMKATNESAQLEVVMARDIDATEINGLLERGLVANASAEELSRLIPELFALGAVIGEQHSLRAGDRFQIIANPDHSTTIRIQTGGAARPMEVTLDQPELFPVMLRIWLGQQPVDGALKQALLGKTEPH